MVYNEDYTRKVLPFLKESYFQDTLERILFEHVKDHLEKYNKSPTVESLSIGISDRTDLSEELLENVYKILGKIKSDKDLETNIDWLKDETEKFCQDKAIYNAVMDSIHILEPEEKRETRDRGEIPKILSDALAVSFDPNVGHDYLEDYEDRFDYYHATEDKVKFDLTNFNSITKGGLSKKSLNIALAGTGVGKSLFMCHCAAANLDAGKNVLYITLEMAEERIAQRIDANLLDIDIKDLELLSKDKYDEKIERKCSNITGKLIIKEYPTAVAHAGHFRHLLNELNLKKEFRPDILYIDYINICASSRIKPSASVNSYTYIKSIAEELRGLAVEYAIPVMSATQTTRTGFSNTDVEITDTSESFGLPATADLMFALIVTEEMDELNQILIKQLKNRYNDPTELRRFVIGIDRPKMKLYDVEDTAQTDLHDNKDSDESENDFSGWRI
jgi:replicative DNA helicase